MNSVETALFNKRTMRGFALVAATCSAFALVGCGHTDKTAFCADYYTRGIGNYPGAPSEHFAPQMVKDDMYRNIALHRAAYHSSSYDYNLTAQLITDGIIRRALAKDYNFLDKDVESIMFSEPLTITPDKMAATALSVMEKHQPRPVTVLPVLDAQRVPVGIVHLTDLLRQGVV